MPRSSVHSDDESYVDSIFSDSETSSTAESYDRWRPSDRSRSRGDRSCSDRSGSRSDRGRYSDRGSSRGDPRDEHKYSSRGAERIRRWNEETQATHRPPHTVNDSPDEHIEDAMDIDPEPTHSRPKPRPLGSEETILVESRPRVAPKRSYQDSLLIGILHPLDRSRPSIDLYHGEGGEIKIGRLEELCQVVIPDLRISKVHCIVNWDGTNVCLRAVGANPIYVNGKIVPDGKQGAYITVTDSAIIDFVHQMTTEGIPKHGPDLRYEFSLRADTMPLDADEETVRGEDPPASRFPRSSRRYGSLERGEGASASPYNNPSRRDDHWEPSRAPPREPRHMRNGRNWEPTVSPTKPYGRPRANRRLARIEEAAKPRRVTINLAL